MDQFLPEQVSVLSAVINDAGLLACNASGIPLVQAREFVERTTAFVRANHAGIGSRHFIMSLRLDASGTKALALSDVLEATGKSTPIIFVNQSFQAVGMGQGGVRLCDAEPRTVSAGHLEAVAHGTYLYFVAGGRVIAERDAVQVGKQPPAGIAFYKPISDLDGLLRDHVDQDLAREKSFRYWANKSQRLLLAKPEKTEKIFQRALYNWLDRYVSDKLRVIAETREFGQDPTDVLVVTIQGDYVIEVKWLGKNEHGTHYEQERINEGLRQVRQYIANDPRIIQGHVVLYDARVENEHRTQSGHDQACRHEFCSSPKVIYLESESPSQKAKLIASPNPRSTRKQTTHKGKGKTSQK